MKICPYCNAPVKDEDRFCEKCGSSMILENAEGASNQNQYQGTQVNTQQFQGNQGYTQQYQGNQGYTQQYQGNQGYTQQYQNNGGYQQQYQGNQGYTQQYQQQPIDPYAKSSGMAIAGMVLGILSIFFSMFCVLPVLGLILSIAGINQCNNGYKGKGMAIAGLVCSLVGLVFGLIWTFSCITAMSVSTRYGFDFDDFFDF